MNSRVFITSSGDGIDALRNALERALVWLDWEKWIPQGSRVFLKPNLTSTDPTPGVTTTPAFIEAVVQAIRSRAKVIRVGDGDGGYHSFEAEVAFLKHGLYELERKYGIEPVNLSRGEGCRVSTRVAGKYVTVELPRVLVEETDVFVTLPVPKVHVMTGVTLGFKNQWGCQPSPMRLRNHPQFAYKVIAINKILKPGLALYDGTYFLDKSGPIVGEPVRMGLVIASDGLGAGELACCYIMGVNPRKIQHLRMAMRDGLMPPSVEAIDCNAALDKFRRHKFTLKRSLINWVALAAFHSKLGTALFYDSALADSLHKVLYTVRRNRTVRSFLYGSMGAAMPRTDKSSRQRH